MNEKIAPLLVKRAAAAKMLGTNISMMTYLEKAGRLTPIRLGERDVSYRMSELKALAGEAE